MTKSPRTTAAVLAMGLASGFAGTAVLCGGLFAITAHVAGTHFNAPVGPMATSVGPVAPAGATPLPARREFGDSTEDSRDTGIPGSPKDATRGADRVTVKRIGRIVLADVGSAVRSLDAELISQRRSAEQRGETLLVWLVVDQCAPCESVARALGDPLMQRALADVRLVRIDVHDFQTELRFLHVPVDKIPGFALLDEDNRPVDYLHGGEWDEDVAKNIAPVLGRFVKGTYDSRREPWRGGRRDDETSL
jgi:hypothetical protein